MYIYIYIYLYIYNIVYIYKCSIITRNGVNILFIIFGIIPVSEWYRLSELQLLLVTVSIPFHSFFFPQRQF